MTRIRHRACYKLRVIDLAPFKWNVSLGILVEDLKTCFYSFLIFRCLYVLQNSSIALKYISKCRTSRTMNISPLRLCSREQTNGIVVFWNFVVIFAFYNSYFIVVLDSTIRMSACFWLFGIQWLTYDCLWSLIYYIKFFLRVLSYYIKFFRFISVFLGWSRHVWLFPRVDRPIRTLHWFTFIIQNNDTKEYHQRDHHSERLRDCSVLELCRNICILQQPFHCCVGLSHPDECVLLTLWYTVIDVWLSVIAWSDRRRPNSRSLASLQTNTGSTEAN